MDGWRESAFGAARGCDASLSSTADRVTRTAGESIAMEDTSSASSDSDNALLSPKNTGHSVSTQTPTMNRHPIKTNTSTTTITTNAPTPPSIVVYKLDAQQPPDQLEKEAKTLAIPDVVVEYIKDTYRRDSSASTNKAFDTNELIVVRTPSAVNLREEVPPIGQENKRLYYSMPRTSRGRPEDEADGPPGKGPTFGRLLGEPSPSASVSSSMRSVPPSPNFGYRPLESETSAVYTIIAPMKYVVTDKNEFRFTNPLEKARVRKFEHSPAPEDVERRRQRLQTATEAFSLLFLIPGLFIAITTPVCLIPMFLLPLQYYIPLVIVFMVSGCMSVVALAISGLFGNVVWHYDPDTKKLRPRMHCGKGPLYFFWGNRFLAPPSKEQRFGNVKAV